MYYYVCQTKLGQGLVFWKKKTGNHGRNFFNISTNPYWVRVLFLPSTWLSGAETLSPKNACSICIRFTEMILLRPFENSQMRYINLFNDIYVFLVPKQFLRNSLLGNNMWQYTLQTLAPVTPDHCEEYLWPSTWCLHPKLAYENKGLIFWKQTLQLCTCVTFLSHPKR